MSCFFSLHLGDMKHRESDFLTWKSHFKDTPPVVAENCRVHVEGQRARVNKTCSGISTRLMPHGPKHRHVPICIHKQHTVTSIYHTFSIRLLHLSRMMAKSLRPWGGRQRDEPKGWGASGERSKGPSGY